MLLNLKYWCTDVGFNVDNPRNFQGFEILDHGSETQIYRPENFNYYSSEL